MDLQPRSKNGHPPHKTTGVLRISCSHESSVAPSQRSTGTPSIGHMASNSTGTVRTRADPKPAGHAPQFRIVLFHSWLDRFRLQFHAALWACSWAVLFDLRVHWARVDDFPLRGDRPCRFQGHAALRDNFPACRSGLPGASDKRIWHHSEAFVVRTQDVRDRGCAALARPFPHRRGTSGSNVRCKSRKSDRPVRRSERSLHPRSCRKWGQLP